MLDFLQIFINSLWDVLGQMAPYLLLGYLIAGVLSVFVTPDTVRTHLGGNRFLSTLKAALVGMPLPLCSCSVIPVTASLHKSGAGRGAVASFLVSTPTTGVDSIMASWALMGPVFAIYRAIMSILLGIVTGVFVNIFGDKELSESTDSSIAKTGHNCSSCDSEKKPASNRVMKALRYGFITLPKDLGKPLFVGIIIASLISALIDAEFIDQFLGGGLGTMIIMLVIGVPLYVCATASIPLALGFMALGASPGAAFVFLVVGPATNAATITVLWKMIGKRSTIILLLCMFAGALVGGMLLDYAWSSLGVTLPEYDAHNGVHAGIFYSAFAVILIFVQLWASYRGRIIAAFSGNRVVVTDSCCSGVHGAEGGAVHSSCQSVDSEDISSDGCCSHSSHSKQQSCCCDEKNNEFSAVPSDNSSGCSCCEK